MNKTTLQGFFEETEKLALDTATMTEAFGIPGAMYEGLKKHGPKGLVGTGLGAAAGLGAGMLGAHYLHKNVTGGAWGRNNPLARKLIEAAPIGLGGLVGGVGAAHLLDRAHNPIGKMASAAAEILEGAVKRAPLIYSEQKKIEALPERYRRAMQALEQTIPMGMAFPPGI
jgi:hypothetical protein